MVGERLRTPLFVIAAAIILVAFLMELGSALWLPLGEVKRPGLGIAYLALIDGLLLFRIGIMGAALLLAERGVSKIQGLATVIVGILVILGGIGLALVAFAKLLLMLGLLMSPPFGTAAYFAGYAGFNRSGAAATLSLLLALKFTFGVVLVLAHQRFLQNKGLVALILTAIVANIIVAFLHGLVPGFLVSITDAVAAIILAIIGIIWALVLAVLSIPAVINALRLDKATT